MANLSQKETMLLKDLKSHEDWCIRKYSSAANTAQDPELKRVFTDLANQERQHLNTLNQIERGETVSMGQSSSGSSSAGQGTSGYSFEFGQVGGSTKQAQAQVQKSNQPYQAEAGQMGQTSSNNPFTRSYQQSSATPEPAPVKSANTVQQPSSGVVNPSDVDLCFDLLNTEKYVSSTYNTAIFEFTDHSHRQALNHIQKEEQEHGEKIYNYLKSKGAYPVQ